ncbi:hypothetical protein EDC96DRAFT_577934 [Choanephora cucurbitarum]|nr:hypothetical protein EDC96DRAFT_577934 [Choanephora cucurbitarum]
MTPCPLPLVLPLLQLQVKSATFFLEKLVCVSLDDDQQELAFSEFKSHHAEKLLIQYRLSKSLRLHHCIIKSNGLQQPVVSINWEEWNGIMFHIVDCGGFFLARKCTGLLIPSDRRLVDP